MRGEIGVSVVEPELVRLMSRIQDANARLVSLHEVGQRTANRVLGTIPDQSPELGNRTASDGLLPALHALVDDLHNRISECDGDMARLAVL